jgi:uncharacterized protein
MYHARYLEAALTSVARTFPSVLLTGPRQSGKSTLLAHFFKKKKATFLSLEDPALRAALREDTLSYLKRLPKPVVLDEIQYFPEITTYVKILIDADRRPGQWFLTGSQQFAVMRGVSESMAGRVAILTLLPMQLGERPPLRNLDDFLISSSYPGPVTKPSLNRSVWYASYLQTYIERDLRMALDVANLKDFEQCLRLLAARTGQILQYSDLATPLGVSVPTIKRWVAALEATYLIYILPPYYENFGKRITKAPKIYFLDMGLVAWLLGLDTGFPASRGPMAGALFETAVVSELVKKSYTEGIKPNLYYWRAHGGPEIDLLSPEGGKLRPYEIKMASRLKPDHWRNLNIGREFAGTKFLEGVLITDTRETQLLPPGIHHLHWSEIRPEAKDNGKWPHKK